MPRNIRRFAWVWLIAYTMQFPAVFLLPPPGPVAASHGLTRSAEQKLTVSVGLLLLGVLLPVLRLAVWKRKNWARWLLFGLFLICLPLLFMGHAFRPDQLPTTLVGITSQLVAAMAF